VNRLLSIVLLCAVGPLAQGQGTLDYLWTWNGDSGLFQGSFEVTGSEMEPNINVGNGLFDLSITSPTGVWISNLGTGDLTLFTYYSSDAFGITVFDPSGVKLVAGPDGMSEELGNATLFGELGNWTISSIPEPSSATLLATGAVAWLARRRKRTSVPRSASAQAA
jgi:hypothetical protein